MRAEDLVRMANQIGHFFAPYPERDAVEGIREHFSKFWDPSMRTELLALAAGQQRTTPTSATDAASLLLEPRVLRAIDMLPQPNAQ